MVSTTNTQETSLLVDHFFRHEYARMITKLVHVYGSQYLDAIEDAVQESLYKALNTWSLRGIPDNPQGWIYTASRNAIIDWFRKSKHELANDFSLHKDLPENTEETEQRQIADEQLNMMFACCHPDLSKDYQIILVLKILCGFHTREVAKALLKSEDAITKAYTRGKDKFKTLVKHVQSPNHKEVEQRIDAVLKIIYLIFNEGYHTYSNELLFRKELCEEAIRLASFILSLKTGQLSKIHALLALMYYHLSRFDARLSTNCRIISLEQQDRQLWNKELIQKGRYHFQEASKNEHANLNEYIVQAGIAGIHCHTEDYKDTNWPAILHFFNILTTNFPGFVYALNRLVAFEKVFGAEKTIEELRSIEQLYDGIEKHKLYHSVKAYLLAQLNQNAEAINAYRQAIAASNNELEKRFFAEKIDHLNQSNPKK